MATLFCIRAGPLICQTVGIAISPISAHHLVAAANNGMQWPPSARKYSQETQSGPGAVPLLGATAPIALATTYLGDDGFRSPRRAEARTSAAFPKAIRATSPSSPSRERKLFEMARKVSVDVMSSFPPESLRGVWRLMRVPCALFEGSFEMAM